MDRPVKACVAPTKTDQLRGTLYTDADGRQEIWRGGSPAWRNNNPGNLRPSARHAGQIGSAWGFAVFTSAAAGRAAMEALLRRPLYQQLTLAQAIALYAPPLDRNPTAAYLAFVAKAAGVGGDLSMGALDEAQLAAVMAAMCHFEGCVPGVVETVPASEIAA